MPAENLIPLAGGLLIAFMFGDELWAIGERMGTWLGERIAELIIFLIFGEEP